MNKKIKKVLTLGLLSTVIIPLFLLKPVSADTESNQFPQPSVLQGGDSRSNVVNNGPSNQYNSSDDLASITDSKTSAVGFDQLYGSSRAFFVYNGEVSAGYEKNNEAGLRQLDQREIGGWWRSFSSKLTNKDANKTPSAKDAIDKKEFHWYAMKGSDRDSHPFASAMGSVQNFFKGLVNFVIGIAGFDMSTISNLMKNSGLSNALTKLFLFDGDGYSPILLVAIAGFMVGILSMGFRWFRGQVALKEVLQEIGAFMIALTIAMFATNSANFTKISEAGLNAANALSISATTKLSPSLAIYQTKTGDASRDAITTQQSIMTSNYVNSWIEAEFGMPVDKLDLMSGTFGKDEDVKKAMMAIAKDGKSEDASPIDDKGELFVVATDKKAEMKTNNLGVYLYAAYSNVKIARNKDDIDPFYWSDSSKRVVVRTNTKDTAYDYTRTLFVIDFLQEINKNKNLSADVRNNIQTMINHLTKPDVSGFAFKMVLLTALNIALMFASFSIILLMISGKLIIVIGVYGLVVFPILMLIPKARKTAKQMLVTYVLAFIRFTLATSVFNALFVITAILSQNGASGVFLAIIIAIALGKFAPAFIKRLNQELEKASENFGGELAFSRNMNQKLFNSSNTAKEIKSRRQRFDHNGQQINEGDGSRVRNVAQAIQQGKGFSGVMNGALYKFGKDPRFTNGGNDFGRSKDDDNLMGDATTDSDILERQNAMDNLDNIMEYKDDNQPKDKADSTGNKHMGNTDKFSNGSSYNYLDGAKDSAGRRIKFNNNYDSKYYTGDLGKDNDDSKINPVPMSESQSKINSKIKDANRKSPNFNISTAKKEWETTKDGKTKWSPIDRAHNYLESNNVNDKSFAEKYKGLMKEELRGARDSHNVNYNGIRVSKAAKSILTGAAITMATHIPLAGDKIANNIVQIETASKNRMKNVKQSFEETAKKLATQNKEVTAENIAQSNAESHVFNNMSSAKKESIKGTKKMQKAVDKEKKRLMKQYRKITVAEREIVGEKIKGNLTHVKSDISNEDIHSAVNRAKIKISSIKDQKEAMQAKKIVKKVESSAEEMKAKPTTKIKINEMQSKMDKEKRANFNSNAKKSDGFQNTKRPTRK